MRGLVHAGYLVLATCTPGERAAPRRVAPMAPTAPAAAVAPPAAQPRPPDPIAPGVTHGGPITTVAVTEQGDAALTLDTLGGLRLWPALDGTRQPVPIHVPAIMDLALTHAGDALLAAFLDHAGSVLLLELGLDGSVRGRAQIPGDVPCEHLVAIAGGVLVAREDRSIEWYDASAHRRGRIVVETGDDISALAARRGAAIALLAPPPGSTGTAPRDATTARAVTLDDAGLHWGASLALPGHVAADRVALSPGHQRIAVIDDVAGEAHVLDTASQAAAVGSGVRVTRRGAELGFTDDDHLAVLDPSILWWRAPSVAGADPPSKIVDITGGAVADGVAVGGRGAALALGTPTAIHYLGWRTPAIGRDLVAADGSVMLTDTSSAIAFDGRLSFVDAREAHGQTWLWLDPRHVIQSEPAGMELVDLDDPHHGVVLTQPTTNLVSYEPALHVLAMYFPPSKVERYVLDLENDSAQPLAALDTPSLVVFGGQHVDLFDPQRADGVIAITRWAGFRKTQGDITNLAIFRAPTAPRLITVAEVLAIDATGAMYVRDTIGGPIVVRRDGKPDAALPGVVATTLVPSRDGALLAIVHGDALAVVDATGRELWRRAVWTPRHLVFSMDDRDLVADVAGGLVSFDARTGARQAVACAFEFGLRDEPPERSTLSATPICEAPP